MLEKLDDPQGEQQLIERLGASLCMPMRYRHGDDEVLLPIAASIGMAAYPADGSEVDALLHAADQAMYLVKRSRDTP